MFAIVILFGCGNTGQKKINLAIVGKANNTPYWDSVRIGSETAGKDLGVSVKFLAPPKEDVAWQIKTIEELIAKKADGIAYAASDPKAIAPVMIKAMQANIPCVAIDTDVAKSRHLYIGTGNYYAGKEAGQIMALLLDDKGEVVVLGNSEESTDLLQRVMGFRDVLAEYINLNVTATLSKKNGEIQPSDVESMLESNPNVNGLFCVSDSSAIIAAQVVQKVNKVGEVKIVCISESDNVMSLIRDGVIQAAVARRPYRMGYLSVLALQNMAKAGIDNALKIMPESGIIDIEISVITSSNIDQYRNQLKEMGIKVKF